MPKCYEIIACPRKGGQPEYLSRGNDSSTVSDSMLNRGDASCKYECYGEGIKNTILVDKGAASHSCFSSLLLVCILPLEEETPVSASRGAKRLNSLRKGHENMGRAGQQRRPRRTKSSTLYQQLDEEGKEAWVQLLDQGCKTLGEAASRDYETFVTLVQALECAGFQGTPGVRTLAGLDAKPTERVTEERTETPRLQENTAMTLDELVALKAQAKRPLTYCLCGSTDRARQAFKDECLRLTLEGQKVLTIGANAKDKDLHITEEMKVRLDVLHLFKIDDADVVRILNVGGYIGESTRRELEYARRLGKRIEFLEKMSTL